MLIDCHTHAFLPEDLNVLQERLTLLDASLADDSPHKWRLHGQGGIADLVAMEAASGAERFVLLPVSGRKDRPGDMNRWAAQAARDHPQIIPFGTLHPLGRVAEDLALLLDLGIKGVKLHPFIQRFSIDHPVTHDLLSLLEGTGLPVLVDTLFVSGLVQAKPHLSWVVEVFNFRGCEPAEIARAAAAHPSLNFIAAHGGSLYGWDQIDPLLELPNVYFDVSYLQGLIAPARLVEIIRRRGPERVLYGSDAPWRDPVSFRQWFEDLPLTSGEREQVEAGTLLGLIE